MEVGKIEQLTDGKKTTVYSTADLPHAPRVYQFAHQEKEIKRLTEEKKYLEAVAEEMAQLRYELQAELDAIRKAMRAYSDSDLVSLAETLIASAEAHAALLEWAQAAYTRLLALMTIGVSMTPDAVTKRLLEDAPDSVRKSAG